MDECECRLFYFKDEKRFQEHRKIQDDAATNKKQQPSVEITGDYIDLKHAGLTLCEDNATVFIIQLVKLYLLNNYLINYLVQMVEKNMKLKQKIYKVHKFGCIHYRIVKMK